MGDYELYHHGIKGQKWGVRRTLEQLGHKKSKKNTNTIDGIEFEKEVHNGKVSFHGKMAFDGNSQCNVYTDDLNSLYIKSVVSNLSNNKKLQRDMRKQSLDELYTAYEGYRKFDPSAKDLTKQEFAKHLKCDQISIMEPFQSSAGKEADSVCWYTTDFYGDWSFEVNSSTGEITNSEFY